MEPRWTERLKGPETIIWCGALALSAGAWAVAKIKPDSALFPMLDRWSHVLGDASDVLAGVSLSIGVAFLVRYRMARSPAERLVRNPQRDRQTFSAAVAMLKRVVAQDEPPERFLRWAANDDDRRELSRLNAVAFQKSPRYAAPIREKIARNLPLMLKAPQAFAFIRSEEEGDIGLSIVIPLTPNFYRQYVKGKLSDHDLTSEMLLAPGDKAGGVLMFAVGLDPRFEADRGQVRDARYTRALVMGHAGHLQVILEAYGDDLTPIVSQAEKANIIRVLQHMGFHALPRRSRDGERLFISNLRFLKDQSARK